MLLGDPHQNHEHTLPFLLEMVLLDLQLSWQPASPMDPSVFTVLGLKAFMWPHPDFPVGV